MFLDETLNSPGNAFELVTRLIYFLDETNLFILVLFVIFLRHVGASLALELPWKDAAKAVTCLFLLCYLVHQAGTVDLFDDVAGVAAVLLRVAVASYLFFLCFAAPLVFVVHLAIRYSEDELRRLRSFTKELDERHQQIHEQPPPPPPPEGREVRLGRSASQARMDYEFECEILRTADLGKDELEAALAHAKQKYLQRLQDALA